MAKPSPAPVTGTPTPAGPMCGNGVTGTCADPTQCCSAYGYCGTGCAYCCTSYFAGPKSALLTPLRSPQFCQL